MMKIKIIDRSKKNLYKVIEVNPVEYNGKLFGFPVTKQEVNCFLTTAGGGFNIPTPTLEGLKEFAENHPGFWDVINNTKDFDYYLKQEKHIRAANNMYDRNAFLFERTFGFDPPLDYKYYEETGKKALDLKELKALMNEDLSAYIIDKYGEEAFELVKAMLS